MITQDVIQAIKRRLGIDIQDKTLETERLSDEAKALIEKFGLKVSDEDSSVSQNAETKG